MTSNVNPALDYLESPLLRVPLDGLRRAAKERKSVWDELEATLKPLLQAPTGQDPSQTQAAVEALSSILQSLDTFSQSFQSVSTQERDEARRLAARLQHMQALSQPTQSMTAWNAQRLDRLVADYLQRSGCYQTADLLIHTSGLTDLVDQHVHLEAKRILEALAANDCGPCLSWCESNRPRLKKLRSQLEFQLRVQQFIELVKAGNKMGAISHARQFMAAWASQYLEDLQRVMAVLVFADRPQPPERYQQLLGHHRWTLLRTLFLQDLYKMHGLPQATPLVAHLQAGLSALKNPSSYLPGCSCQDPLATPELRHLAEQLPYAKHVRSQLLCSVTHKMMDDSNPPVVLPNGYVYSTQAVELIKAQNGGRMVCPHTGAGYAADELRRAHII